MLLQALNKDQQLSRVERWAQKGPADPQVVAELKGFWSEVKKRLAEAHRTMMVLALHKVILAPSMCPSQGVSLLCSTINNSIAPKLGRLGFYCFLAVC